MNAQEQETYTRPYVPVPFKLFVDAYTILNPLHMA